MLGTDRGIPTWDASEASLRSADSTVVCQISAAQLLLRATRVSAADAPPILEERQAREGEARKGNGSAEGKAESAAGRETRTDREGREGRGEAGYARGPAETGRSGRFRERSPRGAGRPRADGRADEGRVCETGGGISGGRRGVRRGVPVRAVQGGDPRPRGLARLPRAGNVRTRCDPERGQPAAQFVQARPRGEGPHLARPGAEPSEGEADPRGPGEGRPVQGRPGLPERGQRNPRKSEARVRGTRDVGRRRRSPSRPRPAVRQAEESGARRHQ